MTATPGTQTGLRVACPVCFQPATISAKGRIRAHNRTIDGVRQHCTGAGIVPPPVLLLDRVN